MSMYWKYAVVAVTAFIVGSVSVHHLPCNSRMVRALIAALPIMLLSTACSVSFGPTEDIHATIQASVRATQQAIITPPKTPTLVRSSTQRPETAVSGLQGYTLGVINEIRSRNGLSELKFSGNEAAQMYAEESLVGLQLLDRNGLGLTPGMSYNQLGGSGYVRLASRIAGYLTEPVLANCRAGRTICERISPSPEVRSFFDQEISSTASDSTPAILDTLWDSISIGVAHNDFTFVIYVLYERTGVEYIELPRIVDGYLTFAVRPLNEGNLSRLDFYYHPLPSRTVQSEGQDIAAPRQRMFSIFDPPPPGTWFQLPDRRSRVADSWAFDGDTLTVAAGTSESIQEEGVYEMVLWSDGDEVPQGQHYLFVEDATAVEKGGTTPPFSKPEPPSVETLRLFALDLINVDREAHGVPPVGLGSNESAQIHAEDALRHGYVGHWTTSGLKPYMIYRLQGGTGVVAENAAGVVSPEHRLRCQDPLIYCAPPDPQKDIRDLQWSMMYDDAHADWGHRETIIDPEYDTVNIGVAYDDTGVSFYQHFESVRLEYLETPSIQNSTLKFRAKPFNADRIVSIAIYYDPPPLPRTAEQIGSLKHYCTGGGFTDECDGVEPILRVLIPAELRWGKGYGYVDLTEREVIADMWELVDGTTYVEADVSKAVRQPGVYTLVIRSEEGPSNLGLYSLFLED